MGILALLIPLSPIPWSSEPFVGSKRLAMHGYDGRRLCKISIVLRYTGAVGCIMFWVSAIRAG